jgi:hypothetical protein
MTTETTTPASGDSTKATAPRRGRPRGKLKNRPRIPLPNGDTAITRKEKADRLGVSERTVVRMGAPTMVFGGVAYVADKATDQIIADRLRSPKRRGRR